MSVSPVASPALGAAQPGQNEWAAADAARVAALPTQLISFAIGDDQYGVDIMSVREIKGWTDITPLPRQGEYVRGVLNLRGIIVPIVDLRCRFGQGLTNATPMHIVIIVQIVSKQIGLLADRVLDIVFARRRGDQAGAACRAIVAHQLPLGIGDDRIRHDCADRSPQSLIDAARGRR